MRACVDDRRLEGSMGTVRRKRARRALVFALASVLDFLILAGTKSGAWDPLSFLLNVAISLAIAFPITYLFVVVDQNIWKWWRTRHPLPLPPVPGSVESFHWTGQPARADPRRTGAVIAVFSILIASLLLLPAPESGVYKSLQSVLIGFFVVFLGLFALGTVVMMRRMMIEVDEQGVRTLGAPRASFSLRWEEIRRIEFVSMEKLLSPFASSTGGFGPAMPPTRMYALLDLDGKVVGHLQPRGLLGRDVADRLEAALMTNASRHKIPIVEVRWRDSMRWRKRKVLGERGTRTT